jgi:membrane protein DedA with SNARE-associated domain
MFKSLIDWYLSALETGSYPLIALLMAIESSIVPLPSELVIPPAAHLAFTTGRFSMVGIVGAGAIGSWVGATAMYWAARLGGRPLVLRFGPYVMISRDKVEGAERWTKKFGPMGVFISRLLPVVRHLIGIPAGIVQMDYRKFSIYTLVGSAIWSAVLCYLGVKIGQDEQLMRGEMHRVTIWLGGAMLVLGSLYYFLVHRNMKGESA